MSNVIRRKGKPNAGGGKKNGRGSRGSAGKHGGGGRKKGSNLLDDYDDMPVDGLFLNRPFSPSGAPSRHGRGGNACGGTNKGSPKGRGLPSGVGNRGGARLGFQGVGSSGGGRGRASRGGTNRGGAGRGRSTRGCGAIMHSANGDRSRTSSSVAKVPMQRLYMSSENQDMVRDMLRDLHDVDEAYEEAGEEYLEPENIEEENYQEDEIAYQLEDDYWMTDNKLCVQGFESNITPMEDVEVFTEEHVSKVASNKLIRYGFDQGRCVHALVRTKGDVGEALEILLDECFKLGLHSKTNILEKRQEDRDFLEEGLGKLAEDDNNDDTDDENDDDEDDDDEDDEDNGDNDDDDVSAEDIAEQRAEEITVLDSIYGPAFSERIANRVWVLGLTIPHLTTLARDHQSIAGKANEKLDSVDNREICRFFLRGGCKYGASRCRYKHEVPFKKIEKKESYKVANPDDKGFDYELELRFPPGNKYPFEAPVVAFSTRNKTLPYHVCLNITKCLQKKASDLSIIASPAAYPLVTILEDEDKIERLFNEAALPFSLPAPLLNRYKGITRHAPGSPIEAVRNSPTVKNSHAASHSPFPKDLRTSSYSPSTKDTCVPSYSPSAKDTQTAWEEPRMDEPMVIGYDAEEAMDAEEREESMRAKYGRSRKQIATRGLNYKESQRLNNQLVEQFKWKVKEPGYQRMQVKRKELPAWFKQDDILAAVMQSQVVVICGMTGCGKSTQVPQYILDASLYGSQAQVANIICTQPRRISAMAVAERVADERNEKCGGTVGYQIRLESCMSARTRLLFCTTGILLRRMEGDGDLTDVTHIILDEVHERTAESDFLLMVLRDLTYKRDDLRLILMSATLNASLFSEYFENCPVVDIPGRTFPVDQYFLEDAIEFTRYALEERSPFARSMKQMNAHLNKGGKGGGRLTMHDVEEELRRLSVRSDLQPAKDNIQDQNLTVKQLFIRYQGYRKATVKTLATMDHEKINYELIESLMEWIVYGDHDYPAGAVLVFLPGMQEITALYEQLLNSSVFGGRNKHKFKLIPLHSTLSTEEQHAVFRKPENGVTKIVIATNIAETSITIDDVMYVIDTGRMKEKRYDSDKGMESLESVWVSRANALQRKGRAGRVASGVAFHLFTSHHFRCHLREQPIPEIQRAPLESIVLRIKMLDIFFGYRVEEILNRLIEPPLETCVNNAIKRLQDIGAFDLESFMTPLGYHLAALPVDVRIGKLMLFGAIFRCLDSALTIAAMLSFKSPFVSPFEKRDEAGKKKLEFATCNSDHLTMLKAYKGWLQAQKSGNRAAYHYCQENFLSIKTMQMLASMKRQFVELLSDIGFIQAGLTTRYIERTCRDGSDGIIETTGSEANCNNGKMKLVAAMLVGALFPNVVQVMTPENKFTHSGTGAIPRAHRPEEIKFTTKGDGYVNIHPSSVNFQVRHFESPYLIYHEKVKTSKVYIHDCTMVSVYPLLLFGGSISIDMDRGEFMLSVDDGWIRFMATSHQVAELVRELRLELDQLLQDKIETPNMDLCSCPRGSRIISTIVQLIQTQ